MKQRFHLTPTGPKPCGVDASNPRSTGCKYGSAEHFEDAQSAQLAFSEVMGGDIPQVISSSSLTVPTAGPPVPKTFYHVARKSDLNSILTGGLEPRIGDRSESLGEDAPRVYLFDSKISAEEGVMSWLGDEFDEEEELVLLSVEGSSVRDPEATYVYEDEDEESGYGPSTEWTTGDGIAASNLRVEGEI